HAADLPFAIRQRGELPRGAVPAGERPDRALSGSGGVTPFDEAQGERIALAEAAERYVGASFRPNGRDPITGFDCLGLVLVALMDIGRPVRVPGRHGLRTLRPQRFLRLPDEVGLIEVIAPFEPGDV